MLLCNTIAPRLQSADFCEEIVMNPVVSVKAPAIKSCSLLPVRPAEPLEKEKFAERESPPSRLPVVSRRRSAAYAAITRRARETTDQLLGTP
jgi:hypothetical protein